MATIEQRISALESRCKPEAVTVASLRPQLSKEEWLELHKNGQAMQPAALREILVRRGDGSEMRHADYIRRMEAKHGNA